ncbi:MAG: hypothetical protein ACR2QQ_00205 [Gammaproteobacteria bacterium]
MRFSSFVAASILFAGMSSCASGPLQLYDGPPLPDSQTALIAAPRSPNDRLAANIRILSIDDVRGNPVRVTSRSVRVIPRGVCVEARATSSTQDSMESELCFNAYGGNRYELRASVVGASTGIQTAVTDIIDDLPDLRSAQSGPFRISRLYIVDVATLQIVASANP